MERGYIGIRKVNNGYVVEASNDYEEDEDRVLVFKELVEVFAAIKDLFNEGE